MIAPKNRPSDEKNSEADGVGQNTLGRFPAPRRSLKNKIIIYFYDAKYQKKCYTSGKKNSSAKKNEKLP